MLQTSSADKKQTQEVFHSECSKFEQIERITHGVRKKKIFNEWDRLNKICFHDFIWNFIPYVLEIRYDMYSQDRTRLL